MNPSIKTLVIFGEHFEGGYINGLIQFAESHNIKVIYSTVGRRTPDGQLRPLNKEELTNWKNKSYINVPLEAGFDKELVSSNLTLADLCNRAGRDNWEHFQVDQKALELARSRGSESFCQRTRQWITELSHLLPKKGDILIAHTMAGGVPRCRVFMPILNRVLKGLGERFFSSKVFWQSDLGQFCAKNFDEVTAQTYKYLIELTQKLREKLQSQGRKIFYTAYSYHGTKVLIDDQYQWQSYAPYLQGFAKLELENISQKFFKKGVNTCIFNVPEILTKSSAVFPGVEIPLYALLGALKKSNISDVSQSLINSCLKHLKPNSLPNIMEITTNYFLSPEVQKQTVFDKWPQHNTEEHIQLMLETSACLKNLHNDPSQMITEKLSQVVLKNCGEVMFQTFKKPMLHRAVEWIGHEEIANQVS